MKIAKRLIYSFILWTTPAWSQTLFEGFYRIERNGIHDGYLIQRLRRTNGVDTLTTYLRQPENGEEKYQFTEARIKTATRAPLSTRWVTNQKDQPTEISAQFNGEIGTVSVFFGNRRKPGRSLPKVQVPRLSAFLFLDIDWEKMTLGQKYEYEAYAEERGFATYAGLRLEEIRKFGDHKFYIASNDYLAEPSFSYVDPRGFPFAIRSFSGDIIAYWVPNKDKAVGTFQYPTGEVTKLFGDLPVGKKNPWSTATVKLEPLTVAAPVLRRPAALRGSHGPLPLRKGGN